jgi:hypothetical protein
MDLLTFIVEITASVVWPFAFIIGIVIFRKPLTRLILAFSEHPYFKFKHGKSEFEAGVKEIKKEVEDLKLNPEEEKFAQAMSIASSNPKDAIIQSWSNLETTIKSSLGVDYNQPWEIEQLLENLPGFPKNKFRLFCDLKDLQNKASNMPYTDVSSGTAIDYIDAVHRLSKSILDLKK